MQGLKRKLVYVTLYEVIAIVCATVGFALMSGKEVSEAGPLSVICSVVAVAWNMAFNSMFEAWESRQATRGRSIGRRVAHAIGFEGGLAAILVPVIAWWLGVSMWEALVMDIGLMIFFLVYTFCFNWAFDRIFGLPASALPAGGAAQSAC
ncbi:PACE efflux transporter [Variovorax dokdonensis]|uniref:PACE efflux transporter n=1 Tax=Variovorax dokdonensis TaxID=344883 RepID=A0ABT7NFF8_9BURK|nr:PACE efflux transporter [Variovorax dokdonensis]MDM0046656.1 PACE efflux transporter [Variovorax dokdonensis]